MIRRSDVPSVPASASDGIPPRGLGIRMMCWPDRVSWFEPLVNLTARIEGEPFTRLARYAFGE